jgi:hypothetical protein
MLEGVQRIVMHEDADRPLIGEHAVGECERLRNGIVGGSGDVRH